MRDPNGSPGVSPAQPAGRLAGATSSPPAPVVGIPVAAPLAVEGVPSGAPPLSRGGSGGGGGGGGCGGGAWDDARAERMVHASRDLEMAGAALDQLTTMGFGRAEAEAALALSDGRLQVRDRSLLMISAIFT